ncbi:MAG: hypothetical protein QOJ12_318 [Thermoleophilales bacterium]|jgi:hypothetical protein|nr:hypothetical protein [Thermoleophilales bacterium]
MLRRAITLALFALAFAAPAVAVAKPTSAQVLECKGGNVGEARSATFLGRMKAIPGTDYMMMRFTLMEQFGDEKLQPVAAPELRFWRQSKPGVKDFRYRQTVTALQGGGDYRMRVEYRWFDAAGNLIRKAQKVTSPCTQPGALPNLQVRAPTAQAGPGGTAVYIVPIANTGKETAHNIAVELFVDGAATNVGHIDAIAPGQTREARFTGPLCQRSLRAVADPTDAIKEQFESDNALQVKCPPSGA